MGAPLELRAGVRVWPALVLVGNVGELHATVWIPVCGRQGQVDLLEVPQPVRCVVRVLVVGVHCEWWVRRQGTP